MLERRGRKRIIAFVMAGGEGSRLRPLTADRCKPAVPFGSRYRIVDFVLTNLVNSDIRSIYLLVQYKPQSLIEHIRKAWTVSTLFSEQFVTVVPPQMITERTMFGGTADAVYQSLNLMDMHRPDLVAVFGADHIYRMDVRQMVRFHREFKLRHYGSRFIGTNQRFSGEARATETHAGRSATRLCVHGQLSIQCRPVENGAGGRAQRGRD